jgi:hypothetical protein
MEDISKTIPVNYALKHLILPLREENGIEVIAMADTSNSELLNELKFIFNKDIFSEQWPQEKLLEAIRQAYQLSGEELTGEESSQGFEYLPRKGSYAEKKTTQAPPKTIYPKWKIARSSNWLINSSPKPFAFPWWITL